MATSMRNTRSDLKDSRFPLKLGLHPAPEWKRRTHIPGPGPGERVRRSEQLEADANRIGEIAKGTSENDS
jgi:hypothetical protein